MRRIRRAPGTQLARAGERTTILRVDKPVPQVRFRATTLKGSPEGRIEIDTGQTLPRSERLAPENHVPGDGLVSLSIVPEHDTAITFLPTERPGNTPALLGGMALMVGAIGWTMFEFLAG